MRYLLSLLFGFGVSIRLLCYRTGLFSSRRLRNPVISVGNLTVGGSGKTPFVAYLSRALLELRYQPVILSRGYGGEAENTGGLVSDGERILLDVNACGDEPLMLAEALPGVPVAVGKNRFASGRSLEERYERVIHLLDDGFQHLALQRDLNVLLIDGTDPFGGGQLLPRGRLREPLHQIARADMVIITRSHLASDSEEIERVVRKSHPTVPIGYFYHDAVALRDLHSGKLHQLHEWIGSRVVVLAAIGNPEVFLQDLRHYQIQPVDQILLPDHYPYSQVDLDRARQSLQRTGARCIVTTEKDGVRLRHLRFGEGEVVALQIEARPEDEKEYLKIWQEEIEGFKKPD